MVKEEYVSVEVAKLLKEKGFNGQCHKFVEIENMAYSEKWNSKSQRTLSIPTHQMVLKWLREEYNIYISIQPDFPSDKDYKMCWRWSVSTLHENCISIKGHQFYIETYEEATEAAIKYCLKNLI